MGIDGQATRITGARVILPGDSVETSVTVADGRIVAIGSDDPADRSVDARGLFLAPALVDLHGDAFERQMMPRSNVYFPLDTAVLETDRQLGANGIATAYHALTLSWEPGLRSIENGRSFLRALDAMQSRLTVENRVQLRWETFAFEAIDLIEGALRGSLLPSVAFNDHTSMMMRGFDVPIQDRAFELSDRFVAADLDDPRLHNRLRGRSGRSGMTPEQLADRIREVWARRPGVADAIARVGAAASAVGAPMLSHDDTRAETRDFYRAVGARVSEFPMALEPARAARDAGDQIVFGAPNVVRGGSHIGSLGAAEMVEAGLCDALASDYYYPAMLAAVARLDAERRADRPTLWRLVSMGPARAMNLHDRGSIAAGQRADLVLVDWPDGATPAVCATWCAGRLAYAARALA